MGVEWASKNAERRTRSRRSTSTRAALGGAQRAGAPWCGFLSRCLVVLAGPSARELGQDHQIAKGGRAPHLEAIGRITAARADQIAQSSRSDLRHERPSHPSRPQTRRVA